MFALAPAQDALDIDEDKSVKDQETVVGAQKAYASYDREQREKLREKHQADRDRVQNGPGCSVGLSARFLGLFRYNQGAYSGFHCPSRSRPCFNSVDWADGHPQGKLGKKTYQGSGSLGMKSRDVFAMARSSTTIASPSIMSPSTRRRRPYDHQYQCLRGDRRWQGHRPRTHKGWCLKGNQQWLRSNCKKVLSC